MLDVAEERERSGSGGQAAELSGDTLVAYIDMSQSQAPCDLTLVVACVSTAEQWERFRVAWLAALKPFGVSVFHATEYVSGITTGRGPYGRLKKDKRRRRIFERRLQRIVRDHVIVNFVDAVPEQDHRALVPYLRGRPRVHADSYYFCLSMCLLRIRNACDLGHLPNHRVSAFAENSTDHKRDNRIKERYESLREWQLLTNFEPMIVGSKDAPEMFGCQGADWVAYGVMCRLSRVFMGRTLGKAQARLADRIGRRSKLEGIMFLQSPGRYRRFVVSSLRHDDAVRRGEKPPGPITEPTVLMSDEECDAYLHSLAVCPRVPKRSASSPAPGS